MYWMNGCLLACLLAYMDGQVDVPRFMIETVNQ